jgi:glycosyltransferase involved in cell wall biosynthesis
MNSPAPASLPQFRKLSILIAAYNEEETLLPCIEGILAAPLPAALEREIILVDDGSRDATWSIAKHLAAEHPQIRVFQQVPNQGKGAALQRAIKEMSGDLAVFQDADLEYDPRDYGRLLAPILDGRADVVFGSRFSGEERKVLYFWHTLANRFLTLVSNMLNDTNWTDMETCYKAFAGDVLRRIPLESNRFGIEPEITAKTARNRLRMYEVPITYNGRKYEEGKKITWKDGVAALWFILKYRFSSRYADSGKVTLDALEQAPKFNQWMYESVRPWLGQRVAELGVGRGNLSKFIRHHEHVLLTDYRIDYLEELITKWRHYPKLRIGKLDMAVRDDYEQLREFAPDSVVFLNVLEHIEDDRAVLTALHETVPPGCRLVILVPFNQKLYSEFDRQLGHFRRYSHGELEEKMRSAGFEVERQFFFNKFGVIAWFIANTLGGQKALTPLQLRVYNFLTPIFRVLDHVLPTSGLSTVVVGRKSGATTPATTLSSTTLQSVSA